MNTNTPTALYLSYDGMTDPLGQSQVLPYLFGLRRKGVQIHLISFEKKAYAKDIPKIQHLCEENGIHWHPLFYTKRPPVLSTLWDIRRMQQLAFRLHKEHLFSIVHCRSYISALVGRNMQRKFNTKFLFDMRGFWADERVEGGIWNKDHFIYRTVYSFFKKKEIEFFTHADAVVSLTHTGKEEIRSWTEVQPQPMIEVIPCCVDLEKFDAKKLDTSAVDELRTTLGIAENDVVLGYVGSIGTWYMLPEMLQLFAALRQAKKVNTFLFLTREPAETIKEEAAKYGIKVSDLIIVEVPHQEVPLYIDLFDVSVFFIRPSFSKKASSPTKQGELMAMGIPIICNAGVGDTDRIIQDSSAGIVIEELTPENFASLEFDIDAFDKAKLRSGAEKWYSLEKGVEQYYSLYRKLLED